jgi:hypothetical protein
MEERSEDTITKAVDRCSHKAVSASPHRWIHNKSGQWKWDSTQGMWMALLQRVPVPLLLFTKMIVTKNK